MSTWFSKHCLVNLISKDTHLVLSIYYYHTSESSSSPDWNQDEKEAIDKLVSDLPTDEEDYLDITLTEEAEFLQEYKTLLNSMKSWFTCYFPLKDEKEAID